MVADNRELWLHFKNSRQSSKHYSIWFRYYQREKKNLTDIQREEKKKITLR